MATKQVYFALCVEVEVADDGTEKVAGAWVDDERASVSWNGEDIWLVDESTWEDIYEHASSYELSQEKLQNAIAILNKEDNNG